jgi:uncharacterized membrane protein YhhN
MIYIIIGVVIGGGSLVTAVLAARSSGWSRLRNSALTMGLLCLLALIGPYPADPFYKGAILGGLLLTLVATAFLWMPGMPAYVGVAHLFYAHFAYWLAFLAVTRLQTPVLWGALVLAAAVGIYVYVAPALREVKGGVAAFAITFVVVVWQAFEVWSQQPGAWPMLAVVGMLLIGLAYAGWVIDSYRRSLPYSQMSIPMLFFAGHLCLALSVWSF